MPHSDNHERDDLPATPDPESGVSDTGNRGSRPTSRRRRTDAVGVLVVDKPSGLTSMTAVAIVRRRIGAKVGHAGTLDPLATGVLVMAVGSATKSLDRLMRTRKGYRTEIDLSGFTATDDREVEPDPVHVEVPPSGDAVDRLLQERFLGEYLQAPPAFSARKVDGRRAYQTARAGGDPKLEPRPVRVHRIALVSYEWPIATIDIACDKGFYVRSLARELGRTLGTGGHCASIRRTAVGPFTLAEAVSIDDVPDPCPPGILIPLDRALARVEEDQSAASG